MKMKKTDQFKIAPELLMGIDLSNSLNGGSSEIQNWLEKTEDGYELTVEAPGVDIDKVTVEVVDGKVLVYYMFPVFRQEEEEGEQFARIIGKFPVPADADYEQVAAWYDENSANLKVSIPYNEHQKGYRSKVTIRR